MDILDKYDISNYIQQDIVIPDFKDKKGIILIVGTSGSGKSTILKNLNSNEVKIDFTKSIIDNFSSHENAETLLISVGLRSIPTWLKKFNEVSNGENHRAMIALGLDQKINIIDEFTSVVDRDTAKSLSCTLRKRFDNLQIESLFVASCHYDIQEWLCPDYIYNTDTQQFVNKEFLRRPNIEIEIRASSYEDWVYFKKHHYLDSSMSKSVHCYTAYFNNNKVGFLSVIHRCGRDIKSYWGECRLVVLPEYQGLGIGTTLSDTIAQEYINKGLRYFSKTSHPAMGIHRENSILWRGTSTNKMMRKSYIPKNGVVTKSKTFGKSVESIIRDSKRLTFSHEYIGIKDKEKNA